MGQPLYKTNLLNPIITDNLILSSHIVVTEQSNDNQLLDNGNILQDRLLDSQNILNGRLITENLQSHQQEQNLILDGNNIQQTQQQTADNNRQQQQQQQILIQTQSSTNDGNQQNYVDQRDPNLIRRNPNDILLVKNNGDYDKTQLVHLGFNPNIDTMQIQRTSLDNNNICNANNLDNIAVYTNLQNANPKKRKLSQDIPLVKSEPGKIYFTPYIRY